MFGENTEAENCFSETFIHGLAIKDKAKIMSMCSSAAQCEVF